MCLVSNNLLCDDKAGVVSYMYIFTTYPCQCPKPKGKGSLSWDINMCSEWFHPGLHLFVRELGGGLVGVVC